MTEIKDCKTYQELRGANWSKLFNCGNVFDAIRWLVKRKKENFKDICEDQDLMDQCLKIIQLEAYDIHQKLATIMKIIHDKNSLYLVEK